MMVDKLRSRGVSVTIGHDCGTHTGSTYTTLSHDELMGLVKTKNVKELIKNQKAHFTHYQDGNMYYTTTNGFEFPIPLDDMKGGVFNNEHEAINLMRWVRKHVDLLNTQGL